MEVNFNYGFDEDSVMKLQKDLNHLLNHLDSQNVRRLYTERCEIKSEGGETVIDGPLLTMYDFNALTSQASTTLRLKMGYEASTSNFVFKLFNNSGIETLSLDANGNAVFSGDIDTSNDVNVGNNIFMGQPSTVVLKGMYFNSTEPIAATSDGYSVGYDSSDGKTGLFWDAHSKWLVLNSTENAQLSGLKWVTIGVGATPTTDYYVNFHSYIDFSTSYGIDVQSGTINIVGGYTNILGHHISMYSSEDIKIGLISTDYVYNSLINITTSELSIHSTLPITLGGNASSGNVYAFANRVSTNLLATKGWSKMAGIQISASTAQSMTTGAVVIFNALNLQVGESTDISWSSSDNGAKINSTKIKNVEALLRLWIERGVGSYAWAFLRKNSTSIAGNILPARMTGQDGWATINLHAYTSITKNDVINAYVLYSVNSTDNKVNGGYANSCVLSVRAIENN